MKYLICFGCFIRHISGNMPFSFVCSIQKCESSERYAFELDSNNSLENLY